MAVGEKKEVSRRIVRDGGESGGGNAMKGLQDVRLTMEFQQQPA